MNVFCTTKRRPLSKIAVLTKDQQATLAEWLFDHSLTYENILDRAATEFQVTIDRTTLHRYRCRLAEDCSALPSTHSSHPPVQAELPPYSAGSNINFSEATIMLLEKYALNLAAAAAQNQSDDAQTAALLESLNTALRMLLAHKRVSLAENLAATRARNAAARLAELDLAREIAAHRINPVPPSGVPADKAESKPSSLPARGNPVTSPDSLSHLPVAKPPYFLQFPPVSSRAAEFFSALSDKPAPSPLPRATSE